MVECVYLIRSVGKRCTSANLHQKASANSILLFAAEGEFNKECAMGLAMGQHIPTDCSVN